MINMSLHKAVFIATILALSSLSSLRAQMLQGIVVSGSAGTAAIAVVDHVCAASADGADVTTGSLNTTGASLVVMFVASYAAVAMPTISDSKGNTWTARTRYGPGAALSSSNFFYAQNPTVGSGHTFTATGPGINDYPAICIIAFSGTATTSVYDVENGNNGSIGQSTIQPGSVTPSQNGEVVLTGVTSTDTGTVSINSGFTIADQTPNAVGLNFGGALAYKIQPTAAAVNPTWTLSGSFDVSSSAATFKAP